MQDPGEGDRSGISGKNTVASNGFISRVLRAPPRQPTGGITTAAANIALSRVLLDMFLGRRAGGTVVASVGISGGGLNVSGYLGAVRTKLAIQWGVFGGALEKSGVESAPLVSLPASIGADKAVYSPRYSESRRGFSDAFGSNDPFLGGMSGVPNPAKPSIIVSSGDSGIFAESERISLFSVIVRHSKNALERLPFDLRKAVMRHFGLQLAKRMVFWHEKKRNGQVISHDGHLNKCFITVVLYNYEMK
jgi:hypothetical protein